MNPRRTIEAQQANLDKLRSALAACEAERDLYRAQAEALDKSRLAAAAAVFDAVEQDDVLDLEAEDRVAGLIREINVRGRRIGDLEAQLAARGQDLGRFTQSTIAPTKALEGRCHEAETRAASWAARAERAEAELDALRTRGTIAEIARWRTVCRSVSIDSFREIVDLRGRLAEAEACLTLPDVECPECETLGRNCRAHRTPTPQETA